MKASLRKEDPDFERKRLEMAPSDEVRGGYGIWRSEYEYFEYYEYCDLGLNGEIGENCRVVVRSRAET